MMQSIREVPDRKELVVVLLIISLAGLFHLWTIREGHNWGGDFSLYIHHAKNIAEGIAYHDTGYIYNPHRANLGPATYPPIFPFLLSPLIALFGLNITVMKIEIILCFLAALLMIYLICREELSFPFMVALVAVIGFHPYFWEFKDNIVSDIPFTLFIYLSLFFIHRMYQAHRSSRAQIAYTLASGFFIYLAYGARSIGLILIPCIFVYEVLRFRKISRSTIIATIFFVFLMVLQNLLLHSDRSYLDQFSLHPEAIIRNAYYYLKLFILLLDNGHAIFLSCLLFCLTGGLAAAGYFKKVKDNLTIVEVFLFFYLLSIIFFPFKQERYLIPLIPLYAFYALFSLQHLVYSGKLKRPGLILVLFCLAVLGSYLSKYTTMDFGPEYEGPGKEESIALFEYIRNNTEPTDVFVFRKPRVLALFTGRSATVYHETEDDNALWEYVHEVDAAYLVTGILDSEFFPGFVKKHSDSLESVYANDDFTIYRIKR